MWKSRFKPYMFEINSYWLSNSGNKLQSLIPIVRWFVDFLFLYLNDLRSFAWGRTICINFSKKLYICWPRNVTLHPIILPCLSLKFAIDFRAFVTVGCWPVIKNKVVSVGNILLVLMFASLTPMLTVIFSRLGPWCMCNLFFFRA